RGGAKRKPDRAQPQEKFGEIFRPKHFAELTTPSAPLRRLRDLLLLAQPPLLFKEGKKRRTIARMPDGAILYSEMTPEVSGENEFNEWYDDEHIPLRMAVPGFRSAQRYRVRGTRNYLVVYEMDSLAVLQSPAYLAVKNNPSARTKTMLGRVTGFTRYVA